MVRDVFDIHRIVFRIGVLTGRLRRRQAFLAQQGPRVCSSLQDRTHPVQRRVALDLADRHERAQRMAQVLLEGVARHRFLGPLNRAGVLVRIFRIEGVVAGDLADLYRVGELIELRSEVSEPVTLSVRHHLLEMLHDGATVGEAPQVAHFEKAWQQPALLDGGKFAVALLAGADNPKTGHALVASSIWSRRRPVVPCLPQVDTSIWPVTAAVIKAERNSRRRSSEVVTTFLTACSCPTRRATFS